MSVVSVAEVRALVRTRLSDADLQVVIDREESWLATRIGVLTGERTETFLPGITDTPLYLQRRAESVVVTDDGATLGAGEYSFTPSTGMIRRVAVQDPTAVFGTAPFFPRWQGTVTAKFTPSDSAAVKRAVIELVRGTVSETGMESETFGDYSYTRGARAAGLTRGALVRSILLRRPAYSARLRTALEPA